MNKRQWSGGDTPVNMEWTWTSCAPRVLRIPISSPHHGRLGEEPRGFSETAHAGKHRERPHGMKGDGRAEDNHFLAECVLHKHV